MKLASMFHLSLALTALTQIHSIAIITQSYLELADCECMSWETMVSHNMSMVGGGGGEPL